LIYVISSEKGKEDMCSKVNRKRGEEEKTLWVHIDGSGSAWTIQVVSRAIENECVDHPDKSVLEVLRLHYGHLAREA